MTLFKGSFHNPMSTKLVSGLNIAIIGGGPAAWACVQSIASHLKKDTKKTSEPLKVTVLSDSDKPAAWSEISPYPLLSHQPRKYFSERLAGFDEWTDQKLPQITQQIASTERGKKWLEEGSKSLTDKEDPYGRIPRSVIASYLEDSKSETIESTSTRTDIELEERHAKVTNITSSTSGSLQVQYDSHCKSHKDEFDHIVLASGMTPPYKRKEDLPDNFIDNMSAPIEEGQKSSGDEPKSQFELTEKHIESVLKKKQETAIKEGRSPQTEQVTIAILGHGGATALDVEYYLSGMNPEIKDKCSFLKFGSPNSSRPKATPPIEGKKPFEAKIAKAETVENLFTNIADIKEEGLTQGYSEGNMRPIIYGQFMGLAANLNRSEKNKLNSLLLPYYMNELATEAAISTDAASSLPNITVITEHVDIDFSKIDDEAYKRKNGEDAFTQNKDGSITFYDKTDKKYNADICINCTGQIWSLNPNMLREMGVNDELVNQENFDAIGASVVFLPVSDESKCDISNQIGIRAGDIVPQLGATIEGATNVGRKIAQKIEEDRLKRQTSAGGRTNL